jgi:transcription initiation factor TFIIH subunit 2
MSRRRADDEFLAGDDEILYDSDGQLEEDRSESGGEGFSSDEQNINRMRRNKNNAAQQKRQMQTRDKGKGKGKAWEGQFERTWDQVQEDERGTLEGAVSDMLLTSKTRR